MDGPCENHERSTASAHALTLSMRAISLLSLLTRRLRIECNGSSGRRGRLTAVTRRGARPGVRYRASSMIMSSSNIDMHGQ
jgi:hypothetical protein